jgi:hypothetical protein
MLGVSGTDVHGIWSPTFGADGLNFAPTGDPKGPNDPAYAAIGIQMGTAPTGLTYNVVDTHTQTPLGEEVYSVTVTNTSTNLAYTFYEYTHYDASAHAAEMFAYATQAEADAGSTSTTDQFFTLTMNANGTYDFHLTSTTSLETTVTTDFTGNTNSGTGYYAELESGGVTWVKSGSPPSTVPSGFDAIIDGWNASNPATLLSVHANNNGFGIGNGNFETNQVINFVFAQDQTGVDIGIGKGNNATTEHFLVTLLENGTVVATEDITLPDGQVVKVDAADWAQTVNGQIVNNHTGTFGAFDELEIENIASASGDDGKVNITTVSFNEHSVVNGTTLNFVPTMTDGDGDTAVSANNLSVTLLAQGAADTGTSASEAIAASATSAGTIAGGGGVDTVDFSNVTNHSVIINLDSSSHAGVNADTAAIQGASITDSLTGITNAIGSSFGGDQLFAASTGSTLQAFGPNDVLNGGADPDTFLAGANLNTTMIGNGGANKYDFNETTPTALGDHIQTLTTTDGIFVDVASQNLTFQGAVTISAAQYATGSDHTANGAFNGVANSFFVETNSAGGSNLWYSADGTAAHAVEIAQIATGVPTQSQIHTH